MLNNGFWATKKLCVSYIISIFASLKQLDVKNYFGFGVVNNHCK